eukprot:GHVN01093769.1.p3 GENE.GHVN01093769.1~~GHVN01093769.1.p3  ORF type:complete len:177 (-),score=21.57 GHVN01093769.1:1344-1874(-)
MELINPMDETLLGPKGAQPPTDRKGSSISASVSVLANTILGVALLGLPWCFSTDGLLLGLGLLIVCACLSAFGLHLLFTLANKMESRINHGGTPLTFAALAGIAHPKARYVLDFVILIKSMGVATSYLLGEPTINQLTPPPSSSDYGFLVNSDRRYIPRLGQTIYSHVIHRPPNGA